MMPTHFGPRTYKKEKSGTGVRFFLVLGVILLVRLGISRRPRGLHFDPATKVEILKGDTLTKFYTHLSSSEVFRLKRYLRTHVDAFSALQAGTYIVSGSYTSEQFLTHLSKGPEKSFISYTVLEGWSLYDIDADLAAKGYITAGEYIAYTTHPDKIAELSKRYDFFDEKLQSLEGFLYPDTYFIDFSTPFINQLVSIQLNTFKKKVREPYVSDFSALQSKYGLSVYQAITLASIVEKEEKKAANKPTVAGIFYNRLQKGMLLGADITLCYNFKKPYTTCTPSVIAKNVADASNPYNTRQVAGLPPTPIANPHLETFKAVLFPQKTSYLFYLHDAQGGIHYAETNEGHNQNKAKWL